MLLHQQQQLMAQQCTVVECVYLCVCEFVLNYNILPASSLCCCCAARGVNNNNN